MSKTVINIDRLRAVSRLEESRRKSELRKKKQERKRNLLREARQEANQIIGEITQKSLEKAAKFGNTLELYGCGYHDDKGRKTELVLEVEKIVKKWCARQGLRFRIEAGNPNTGIVSW